jgi:hypothetical protein
MGKQQTNKTSVTAAEAVLADLETKRQRHRERAVELEAARKHASYGAHVQHDSAEKKALDAAVDASVRHEGQGRALGAAEDFDDLDKGLALAADAAHRIYERYETMRAHGLTPPAQLTLMLRDVMVSALMDLPAALWKQLNFDGLAHLPPNRRRSAVSLRGVWGAQVERQAVTVGGEQPQQTNNTKTDAA